MSNDWRATHWYWHSDFSEIDARCGLTWRNRFSSVNKAINFYSSEDEVLKCGKGESQSPLQREYAWYNQERTKGLFTVSGFRVEGGWGFNYKFKVWTETAFGELYKRSPTPEEANAVLSDFKVDPLFDPFQDSTLHTNGIVTSISRSMVSQLLADAIPSESLPAGGIPVLKWDQLGSGGGYSEGGNTNLNMPDTCKDTKGADLCFDSDEDKWIHSFFLSAPYMVVHKLFDKINEAIK